MSDKEVSDKANHGTTKGYELLLNLPIPPDDPQGHPFKKTRMPRPAYFTPTAT